MGQENEEMKSNPWIFTTEEIRQLRSRANEDARTKVQLHKQHLEEGKKTHIVAESFAKGYHKSTASTDERMTEANEKFPTVEEELILLNFYCTKLPSLIGPDASTKRLQRDIKVASTAAVLLRRFYLSNSIVLFDPKAIMVACAFLASKIEGTYTY